ncbi:MAG: hypothetical protein Tsb0020_30440 [Haliangiales bacterium]
MSTWRRTDPQPPPTAADDASGPAPERSPEPLDEHRIAALMDGLAQILRSTPDSHSRRAQVHAALFTADTALDRDS